MIQILFNKFQPILYYADNYNDCLRDNILIPNKDMSKSFPLYQETEEIRLIAQMRAFVNPCVKLTLCNN